MCKMDTKNEIIKEQKKELRTKVKEKISKLSRRETEESDKKILHQIKSLAEYKNADTIFCYVSTEQGVSIFMSTFLEQYHGIDPKTVGAQSISYFWGSMTVGCLFGMFLLKLIDSKRLLQISGLLSMSLLLIALFGSAKVAVCAFPAIGFCISMMYSIVFSLALNTVAQNHGSFAGILCSGIVGGAGGPLFVSLLSDTTSLRIGMLLILVFMGYITFIGFWAHPLVNNKTVSLKELVGFKNKNKILR